MAHYIGKIDLMSLVNATVADVEYDEEVKKCIVIPIKDNNLKLWNGEYQLWFRAMAYLNQTTAFSHFIMQYIPRQTIKKMSQNQLEQMANHRIGGMIKSNYWDEKNKTEKEGLDD